MAARLVRLIPVLCACACVAQSMQDVFAQPVAPEAREVPARSIPVPDTVSPQMQALIAGPLDSRWQLAPQSPDEWKAIVEKAALGTLARLPGIRESLGVSVHPTTIAGVRAFIVTPTIIAPRNRKRILLHLHGGVRVFNPGESGTLEAVLMAGFAGFKIISVDYRMPPDFPFPAALDDAVTVYREILKTTNPRNVGIFGSSAGGSLAVTTLLRAKAEVCPCLEPLRSARPLWI